MKKIISVLLSIVCVISLVGVPIYAENYNVTDKPCYIGSSPVSPYSIEKPSKEWNLKEDGRYDFKGSASSQDLYTNYLLTGKTSVKIYVLNKGDKNLSFALYKNKFGFDEKIGDCDIASGADVEWPVSDLDEEAEYYIKFYAPCEFSGYIE